MVKYKKISLFILMFFSIFFINPKKIMAERSYTFETIEEENMDVNSNIDSSQELIICSYQCSSETSDAPMTCNPDENFSSIKYYHDDNITDYWEIKTNLKGKEKNMNVMGTTTVLKAPLVSFKWEEFYDAIPFDGIYYEEANNVNESWKNTEAYSSLRNSFVCPKYVYYDNTLNSTTDKKNNMELCYADNLGKCENRNEKSKTTFKNENILTYNFTEELNEILDWISKYIENQIPDDFMRIFFDVNGTTVCTALSNFDSDGFSNLLEEENFQAYYDVVIDMAQSDINTSHLNEKFYTYENLTKLLVKDKGKNNNLNLMYNGQSLSEKFNNIKTIYSNKFKESVDHFKKLCKVENTSQVDSNKVQEQLDTKLENLIGNYKKIEFTELNCDNLFADIADLIKTAYFIIEIGSIILVIVFSILEYMKVFMGDGQDELKKTNKRLITRLIILLIILLLPALVNFTLKIFKIEGFDSEKPLCVNVKK